MLIPRPVGKGSDEHGHEILSAAGMQYLIASNTHILGETAYRGFELPLLHELDSYKEKAAENEERYKAEEARRGRELRSREGEYLKLARQKRRSMVLPRTYHEILLLTMSRLLSIP